ncbi:MAG: hypothetical protein WCX71_05860 [Candidatus Buchananbacteria bacterium]
MQRNRLKQFKKEAKQNQANIQKGLMSIYRNQDGSLPDISHLEVRHKSKLKLFLIGIIVVSLILSIVTWLGFLLFNPTKSASNKSIKLTFDAPQNIASGDEITYNLSYKNIDNVALRNVEIMIRYPDDFQFISAQPVPTNTFNTSWKIGDLEKGASGQIAITGKLIGAVGSIKSISATASFQPENFSSSFKESSSFSHQITSSILELNIEGPDKILPQKKATYKITYKNNSEQDLSKLKVIANYPTNFIYQDAEPKPAANEGDNKTNSVWVIDSLAKQQEGSIELSGGFVADKNILQGNIKVQIGFIDDQGNFSLQQEKDITTEITEANLSLDLIINGSAQSQPINFGQTLTYSLNYKNLGQKDIDDAVFSVAIDSGIVDWESLDDKNGGRREGNKISWNKDQISQLDLIRPLDEGTITFSIKVKEANQIDMGKTNLIVKSQALATMLKLGETEVPDLTVESTEIQNNINTDIDLKVEGRYFDEDNMAVGTGPLPPVVGQPTTFRIYWSLANSLHEVTDVRVSAVLPAGVSWYDKKFVKVGDIKYDASTRTVTWSIGRITANKNYTDVNCWFDVSVVPTSQQLRKLLILTDQVTMTAKDKTTDSLITKNGKAITSNLEDDPIGGGKGLVIDITE